MTHPSISQNHGSGAERPHLGRRLCHTQPVLALVSIPLPSLAPNSPEFLPLPTYLPDERGLLTPPRARLFVLPIPLRQRGTLLSGFQRRDIAHKLASLLRV